MKVRVGEYDASGFNPPETRSHIEYTVSFDFTQISSTSIQHWLENKRYTKFNNDWHPPQVSKIVRHPQFDAKRLSDDIAVMITSRVIGEDFFSFVKV